MWYSGEGQNSAGEAYMTALYRFVFVLTLCVAFPGSLWAQRVVLYVGEVGAARVAICNTREDALKVLRAARVGGSAAAWQHAKRSDNSCSTRADIAEEDEEDEVEEFEFRVCPLLYPPVLIESEGVVWSAFAVSPIGGGKTSFAVGPAVVIQSSRRGS